MFRLHAAAARPARRCFVAVLALAGLFARLPCAAAEYYPHWWYSRGVAADATVQPDDYAAANQGQAKWIASRAKDELDANLPGGAGAAISNLVAGFVSTNDFLALNLGQLKFLAAPFYDRLREVGWSNAFPAGSAGYYPWTPETTDDNDFSIANLGQLKWLFSFDPEACLDSNTNGHPDREDRQLGLMQDLDTDANGIPDWWQQRYSLTDPNGDPDKDELTNLEEYRLGTSPRKRNRVEYLNLTDLQIAYKSIDALRKKCGFAPYATTPTNRYYLACSYNSTWWYSTVANEWGDDTWDVSYAWQQRVNPTNATWGGQGHDSVARWIPCDDGEGAYSLDIENDWLSPEADDPYIGFFQFSEGESLQGPLLPEFNHTGIWTESCGGACSSMTRLIPPLGTWGWTNAGREWSSWISPDYPSMTQTTLTQTETRRYEDGVAPEGASGEYEEAAELTEPYTDELLTGITSNDLTRVRWADIDWEHGVGIRAAGTDSVGAESTAFRSMNASGDCLQLRAVAYRLKYVHAKAGRIYRVRVQHVFCGDEGEAMVLLSTNYTTRGAEGVIEFNPSGTPIPPPAANGKVAIEFPVIQIIGPQNSVLQSLCIAKWETAFDETANGPTLKSGFPGSDPDSFRIRVFDPARTNEATLYASFATIHEEETYSDASTREPLYPVSPGVFVSHPMILVSTHDDDAYPLGGVADEAEGDLTHRAMLGGVARVYYEDTECPALEVPVPAPSDLRTIALKGVIVRNTPGGDLPITVQRALDHFQACREILAQANVLVTWGGVRVVDPPFADTLGMTASDRLCAVEASGPTAVRVSHDAQDLLRTAGTVNSPSDTHVVFLHCIREKVGDDVFAARAGGSLPFWEFTAAADRPYRNTAFVSRYPWMHFREIAAHEVGHLLGLRHTTNETANLMSKPPRHWDFETSDDILSSRRLSSAQEHDLREGVR